MKKFSLEHNHICKMHGNITPLTSHVLYYRFNIALFYANTVLRKLQYSYQYQQIYNTLFMVEPLSPLNYSMASNAIVLKMSNPYSWTIKVT